MLRLARWLAGLGLVLLAAGFVAYLAVIAGSSPAPDARADAIVVLTGGGGPRVETGLQLLEQGAGERLLISGVFEQTTLEDIRAMAPPGARRIDCCVDLDHVADSTTTNARETAAWAREHGYDSLILVTHAYHLPRSRVELARSAPDLALVPYPVGEWSEQDIRHLLLEYAKLVFVLGREAVARLGAAG